MFAKAQALHRQGLLDQAQALYEALLRDEPAHADALHMLGVLAVQTQQPERARALITQSLALNPHNAAAHYNLGVACKALGHTEAAVHSYDRALALQPDDAQVHYNRGVALQDLGRDREALAAYDRVVALQPQHVQAHMNRGNVLRGMQQHAQALASYAQALALQPDYAEAHYNRGVALQDVKHHADALDCFDRAIAHGARFAAVHNNRGNALLALQRFTEAIASYDAAIAAQPDYADAHCNRGIALQELKQYAAALQCLDRTLALEPGRAFVRGLRQHLKMQCADWSDFDQEVAQLAQAVLRGEKAVPPIAALAMADSLAVQQRAAATWAQYQCAQAPADRGGAAAAHSGRIRIGYYSADFHNHAMMYLLAQVFELHDKSRFELFAFSFGPSAQDAMRARALAAFDHFIEVGGWTDAQVAQHSRALQIDIAVDLKGYSHQSRPAIFAHRAAPVQVNYLGHPGTMALPAMDYTIADGVLIPDHHRHWYPENLVYMPTCYQPNDGLRTISDRAYTRVELGLPEQGFVFCSFNATYKITPQTFDGWMRILRRVEGSVLWLFESQAEASANLRAEAVKRGVGAERIVFARGLPLAEHLARHRCAGLFLDTLPCNAHTTASDALWAGLPVLTRMGETFASRVAASLLQAMNLPELVTLSQQDYEERAVALAHGAAQLGALRQRLIAQRLATPLFDTPGYTRQLEETFVAMVQRSRAGLPPQDL